MIAGVHRLKQSAALILTCVAVTACGKGGSGDSCKSSGPLGALTCDGDLICNGAAGNICEPPMSRPANGACDVQQLCAAGLWCDLLRKKCVPFLNEGDACTNPFSCGPDFTCTRDPATATTICRTTPDGGVTGATVMGTLTLPGTAQATGMLAFYTTLPPAGTAVATAALVSTGTTSLDYLIGGVPAGTYFILGFIDVDGSGGTSSTPGDYAGWYGHNGDGNPPAAANAVVPDSGTVRFDFSLVLR